MISPPFPSRLRALSRSRGFTLVELMAVVLIVAVLAVIAVPSASTMMRERRSASAAGYIAQQYRMARARSLGRSSAVMVRFNKGRTIVIEAISGTGGSANGCALIPTGACDATVFADPTRTRVIDDFAPGTGYEEVAFQFSEYAGTTPTTATVADICYSSSGRTWIRMGGAGSFSAMSSVVDIRVRRESGSDVIGIERHIYILPNGMARLAL